MKIPALVIAAFIFLQETHGSALLQSSLPKRSLTSYSLDNHNSNVVGNINKTSNRPPEVTMSYNMIIHALAYRSYFLRMDIANNLIKEYGDELSGPFKDLIIAITTSPLQYYAKALHDAMDSPTTDETCLIDILCTLGNEEIKDVKGMYEHTYGVKLQTSIEEHTSSHFKELLLALLNGTRDESPIVNKGQEAFFLLLEDFSEEKSFIDVFSQRSYVQLRYVVRSYNKLLEPHLDKAIENQFSGPFREALLAILHFALSPSSFFSERLQDSLSSIPADDKQLIRIVTMGRQVDMELIKMNYKATYGITLEDDIAGSTSGEFKDGLLALIGHTRD